MTVGGLNVAHLVSSHVHHELVGALGGARRQRRWTHEDWNVVGTSIDFLPDVAAEPVRSARIDRLAFLACPKDLARLCRLTYSLRQFGRGRRRRFDTGDDCGHQQLIHGVQAVLLEHLEPGPVVIRAVPGGPAYALQGDLARWRTESR